MKAEKIRNDLQKIYRLAKEGRIKKSLMMISKIKDRVKTEKKLISELIKDIEKGWDDKQFSISIEEFRKLKKEKNVEENLIHATGEVIESFFHGLKKLENKVTFSEIEAIPGIISNLNRSLDEIRVDDDWLHRYLERLSTLKYDRRVMSGIKQIMKRLRGVKVRIRVKGLENIPTAGACIIMSRHYHAPNDFIILNSAIPRKLFSMASVENFITMPEKLVAKSGALPYKPKDLSELTAHAQSKKNIPLMERFPASNTKTLREILFLLEHGEAILNLPEGRSVVYGKSDLGVEFSEPKPWAIQIARLHYRRTGKNVLIIPVGINYLNKRCSKADVSIGEPIVLDFSDCDDEKIQRYLHLVFGRIKELSGAKIDD